MKSWPKVLESKESRLAQRRLRKILSSKSGGHENASSFPGLHSGRLGQIVVRTYAQQRKEGPALHSWVRDIGSMLDVQVRAGTEVCFWSGLPGLLWLARKSGVAPGQLARQGFSPDFIISLLRQEIKRRNWKNNYEFTRGLVGVGIGALAWRKAKQGQMLAGEVLVQLERVSVLTSQGRKFPAAKTEYGREIHNMGLAHGLPCVISFLSFMIEARIEVNRAQRLLNETMSWLLMVDQKRKERPMPMRVGRNIREAPTALPVWCYGDAGVSISVMHAARATGRKDWYQKSIDLMDRAVRVAQTCGLENTSLCHGTSGLALILHRFYEFTKLTRFKEASKFWYLKTIVLCESGGGVAGTISGDNGRKNDTSILTGSDGVALALTAALSGKRPYWDSMMLLSSP